MSDQTTLEYRARETEPARSWYPKAVALAVLPLGMIILILSVSVIAKFKQIFIDFKIELPVVTRLMLQAGSVLRNPLMAILWVIFIAGIPALVGLVRQGRPMEQRDNYRIIVLGVLVWILFFTVIVISLMAPMLGFIQSVSGPNGKH